MLHNNTLWAGGDKKKMYDKLMRSSATVYTFRLPKSVKLEDVLFSVSNLHLVLTPDDYTIVLVGDRYELRLKTALPVSSAFISIYAFYQTPKGSK